MVKCFGMMEHDKRYCGYDLFKMIVCVEVHMIVCVDVKMYGMYSVESKIV